MDATTDAPTPRPTLQPAVAHHPAQVPLVRLHPPAHHPIRPPTPAPARPPDLHIEPRPSGFAAHMRPDAVHLAPLRALTARTLADAGVEGDTQDAAVLVVAELTTNALRAADGDGELLIEVDAHDPTTVHVAVHDPAPPFQRPDAPALDSPEAESGRGLALLDILAPGWEVIPTEHGKCVCCHVPRAA